VHSLTLIQAELQQRKSPWLRPLLHDLSQVLYLPFDYDDGLNARDRSGYKNHGTLNGPTRVAGKISSALSFDGIDDYVEVPHSTNLYLNGDFTILVWATLEKTPIRFGGVIDKGRRTINDFWFLSRYTFNQFLWGIGFTDDTFQEQIFPIITLGEWNFYAFGVEGSKMFISLNGAAKVTTTFTKTRDIATQNLTLGCWNDISAFEEVKLDEVRIFNRALSQAEILRLMYMRI